MRALKVLVLLLVTIGALDVSEAATCSVNSPITGFTAVKTIPGGKSYFFSEPRICDQSKPCSWRRKAYLVPENFVQTAQVQNGFVCAIFRDFYGSGGRKTVGWLLLSDLEPIRTKPERKDLLGAWVLMPCPDGDDDCMIDIAEDEKKELQISIMSHIHSHPGISLDISAIKQEKGKLILTAIAPGSDSPETIELVYDAKDVEPGTISLTGDDSFQGVYRK